MRDEQAIEAALRSYEAAVNASDAPAASALFAADGVLMAENSPSCIGMEAIRAAYRGMLDAIALSITFTIAEVKIVAPQWAFLRSTSNGTVRIKANGATVPEANQELFVFQHVSGAWKIARYSFSTTLPTTT